MLSLEARSEGEQSNEKLNMKMGILSCTPEVSGDYEQCN